MGKTSGKFSKRGDVINNLTDAELHYILSVYSPPLGWSVVWTEPSEALAPWRRSLKHLSNEDARAIIANFQESKDLQEANTESLETEVSRRLGDL
jgi:hypothetical protein